MKLKDKGIIIRKSAKEILVTGQAGFVTTAKAAHFLNMQYGKGKKTFFGTEKITGKYLKRFQIIKHKVSLI